MFGLFFDVDELWEVDGCWYVFLWLVLRWLCEFWCIGGFCDVVDGCLFVLKGLGVIEFICWRNFLFELGFCLYFVFRLGFGKGWFLNLLYFLGCWFVDGKEFFLVVFGFEMFLVWLYWKWVLGVFGEMLFEFLCWLIGVNCFCCI